MGTQNLPALEIIATRYSRTTTLETKDNEVSANFCFSRFSRGCCEHTSHTGSFDAHWFYCVCYSTARHLRAQVTVFYALNMYV